MTQGKVVLLPGVVPQHNGPSQKTIEFLQSLLLLAESGEVVAIGCFLVDPLDRVTTAWAGDMTVNVSVAGAAFLQHDLIKDSKVVEASDG